MSKPYLIIDPGHGGKDGGGGSNSSFLEKNMNLKISLYQYNRFKKLGIPVSITREDDIYLSSFERAKIVKESDAKYCISNHINAASNSEARGVETIHSIYSDGKIARVLYNAIVELGMKKRRVFSRESYIVPGKDYYYMHRETGRVITTIIEYGFATNKEDTKLLEKNWAIYAESVVKSFCEFNEFKYIPEKEDIISEPNIKLPQIKEKANVVFEGKKISAYITDENRSVVEIRELSELFGYNVNWDSKTKTVNITRNKANK